MAWYYHQDTNAYLQNAASSYATEPDANATYVRDSYPVRIDYGFTAGNAYSADGGHAPDQVLFEVDTAPRPAGSTEAAPTAAATPRTAPAPR